MKESFKIFKKRHQFIIIIMLSLFLSTMVVSAHSPSNMSLSYDKTTKELEVTIDHQVSNPDVHYVYNIVIKINDVTNRTVDYTSQSDSSFSYSYQNIEAGEGDIIEITASCNQGGSITKQLTIGSDDTTSNGDGSSTPGFELIILLGSLILVMIIINKKK